MVILYLCCCHERQWLSVTRFVVIAMCFLLGYEYFQLLHLRKWQPAIQFIISTCVLIIGIFTWHLFSWNSHQSIYLMVYFVICIELDTYYPRIVVYKLWTSVKFSSSNRCDENVVIICLYIELCLLHGSWEIRCLCVIVVISCCRVELYVFS